MSLVALRRPLLSLAALLGADLVRAGFFQLVRSFLRTSPVDPDAAARVTLLGDVSQGLHVLLQVGVLAAAAAVAAAPVRSAGRGLAGAFAGVTGLLVLARGAWLAWVYVSPPPLEVMEVYWGVHALVAVTATALLLACASALARAAARPLPIALVAAGASLAGIDALMAIGSAVAVIGKTDLPSGLYTVSTALAYAAGVAEVAVVALAARAVASASPEPAAGLGGAYRGASGAPAAGSPVPDAFRIAGALGTLKGAFVARFTIGILGGGAVLLLARESPAAAQALAVLVGIGGAVVSFAIAAAAVRLAGLPAESRAGAPASAAVAFLGAGVFVDAWATKLLLDVLGAQGASSFWDRRLSAAMDAARVMPWIAAAGQAIGVVAAVALLLALAAVARWVGEATAAGRVGVAVVLASMAGLLAIAGSLLQVAGREGRDVAPIALVGGATLGLVALVLAGGAMSRVARAAAALV